MFQQFQTGSKNTVVGSERCSWFVLTQQWKLRNIRIDVSEWASYNTSWINELSVKKDDQASKGPIVFLLPLPLLIGAVTQGAANILGSALINFTLIKAIKKFPQLRFPNQGA